MTKLQYDLDQILRQAVIALDTAELPVSEGGHPQVADDLRRVVAKMGEDLKFLRVIEEPSDPVVDHKAKKPEDIKSHAYDHPEEFGGVGWATGAMQVHVARGRKGPSFQQGQGIPQGSGFQKIRKEKMD